MSFAWASKIPVSEIIGHIGHDGSRIIWPNQPEPLCREGFHIQELIDVMLRYGFAVTPFEAVPTSKSVDWEIPHKVELPKDRIEQVIQGNSGVFVGTTLKKIGHAIGWRDNTIHDPAGRIKTLEEFWIRTFYLLSKIRST